MILWLNVFNSVVNLLCYCVLLNMKSVYILYMCLQDSEGLVFHYWALFDGHAGSGAAVVASRLLQHHIACQLQAVIEIIRNLASLPPTVLGEEPDNNPYLQGNTPGPHRSLTRAASLRGAAGAPGSPCSTPPPPRFFTEKKIQHESLVVGAIENAFKEMVRDRCKVMTHFSPLTLIRPESFHTLWESPCRASLLNILDLAESLIQRNVL